MYSSMSYFILRIVKDIYIINIFQQTDLGGSLWKTWWFQKLLIWHYVGCFHIILHHLHTNPILIIFIYTHQILVEISASVIARLWNWHIHLHYINTKTTIIIVNISLDVLKNIFYIKGNIHKYISYSKHFLVDKSKILTK